MMIIFSSWLVIILIIISFLWKLDQKHYKVIVGILSSRENSRQRSIIRSAFHKQFVGNDGVLLKFIVARYACTVPTSHRIDIYDCQSKDPDGNDGKFFLHTVNEVDRTIFKPNGPVGFDFDVYGDIIIDDIGFLDYENDGIKGNVKAIVYNRITEDPVLAVVFLPFSQGKRIEYFRYKSVEHGNLTKGFKGTLIVEGMNSEDVIYFSSNCKPRQFGSLKIHDGVRLGQHVGEFPENRFQHGCIIGPTFSFRVLQSATYQNEKHIESEYAQVLHQEKISIQEEIRQYSDLLLVDTIESYRNLPRKMLKFYSWVSSALSFDYILKSDDDCFIDLQGILHLLDEISIFEKTNLWIGNFRENFAIDRKGKWAEHAYRAASYPPFACGSGYLLSTDLVQWLSLNQNKLKFYQGEDTSLGIWLAAIAPNRIQDDRFQCARTCKLGMLTLPENTVSQLSGLYNKTENLFKCNNF